MSGNASRDGRAFVLGLDGVPWGQLSDWVQAGHLPAFARLFESGATGPLRSTTPATTALAWPSIATGVRPDKHRIYSFQRLNDRYTHQMNTSTNRAQPALWDVLDPAVVGNVPMTYPATEIDGKMVTGMMTPRTDDGGFTHPPELAADIADRIPEYSIGLDWSKYATRREQFLEDLEDLVTCRRRLLDLLLETEDWRLFFFVFTAPDRLQHLIWEERVLLDHYRVLDDVLADVMETVERGGGTLYVVSDHGFGPVDGCVNVNTILFEEGYLVPRDQDGTRGVLQRVGLTRERVQAVLSTVGIDDETIVHNLPRSIVDTVAAAMPGDHGLYDVDYTRTSAFMHGPGNVYVNDTDRFDPGVVDPAEVGRVKDELVDVLSSVTDPRTGEPALELFDGDELFPSDPESPDLVVESETRSLRTAIAPDIFTTREGIAADHRPDGVLLAWGDQIADGASVDGATVFDVAPTVLHQLGEAVPAASDGRVLSELFEPGSGAASRSPEVRDYVAGDTAVEAGGDFDGVEERLRGLGYLE